ncbi:MAG: DUF1573 domain-containing protein [Planctomycetia bacterium]|nr:DUF1573 domain-containing protein [Planctomycetia bacterium]
MSQNRLRLFGNAPARTACLVAAMVAVTIPVLYSNAAFAQDLQPHKKQQGTGRLELLTEARQSFGSVVQGDLAKTTFSIRNSGRGNVTVQLAEKSCGCTSVRINGKELLNTPAVSAAAPLAPVPDVAFSARKDQNSPVAGADSFVLAAGRTAKVEVAVDSRHAAGPVEHAVKLTTSDPEHPLVELQVAGDVVPRIELSTQFLDLGDLPAEKNTVASIRVTSRIEPDLQIKQVVSSNPSIKARVEAVSPESLKASGDKAGFNVVVEVAAGQPIGLLQGELTIITSLDDQPVLTVPVTGRVTGDVQLMPSEAIDFGLVQQGQPATQGAYAKIHTKVPVTVKVARVEPESLKVELHRQGGISHGQQFVIVEVTLPAQKAAGVINGVIELETTHPTAKKVRIPVRCQVIESSILSAR